MISFKEYRKTDIRSDSGIHEHIQACKGVQPIFTLVHVPDWCRDERKHLNVPYKIITYAKEKGSLNVALVDIVELLQGASYENAL